MQWLVLVIAFLLYSLCCWLTYSEGYRDKWWYLPLGIMLGATCNLMWLMMTKAIDDKDKIFIYALFWDAVIVAVFYGLPIFFFGVKLDKWGLLGVLMIVIGLTIIKVRSM